MGRTLLLTVIMVTVIFAGLAISLLQRSNTLPDMATRNLDTIALKNTGAFALNYAIKQLQTNSTLKNSITQHHNHYALTYNNFDLQDTRIDSLKFAYYNSDKDSLQILAVVSKMVDGSRKYRTSEARIGLGAGAHPDQVAGWNLDEGSGDIANEYHNGSYSGTLQNFNNPDNAWVAGKWGNALNFDGSNDYVELAEEVVDSWDEKFTAASWVKLDNSFVDWGTIMSEQKTNAHKTVVWAVTSRLIDITFFGFTLYSEVKYTFTINTKGNPNISSVSISQTGNETEIYDWHFIVATYDGTYSKKNARIELQMIDENLSNSAIIRQIQYHSSNNNPHEMTIGGIQTNRPWSGFFDMFRAVDGTIDEVNFFNEVLSAEDIDALFVNNAFASDQIIYWRQ
ncbi:MAG: LamG-like jellyroll fold domain-containing protein [Candidatus Cloacimonadales bacterium]